MDLPPRVSRAPQQLQSLQFQPPILPAPRQDYDELKARIGVLEEALNRLETKLEAMHQESLKLKIEPATTKSKLENHENKSASITSPEPQAQLNPNLPMLSGNRKRDFMDWYFQIEPILPKLGVFGFQDRLDYVDSMIDPKILRDINDAYIHRPIGEPRTWNSVRDYVNDIGMDFYDTAGLLW